MFLLAGVFVIYIPYITHCNNYNMNPLVYILNGVSHSQVVGFLWVKMMAQCCHNKQPFGGFRTAKHCTVQL